MTRESWGRKPSTTGTAARRSSGPRAVSVVVMGATVPDRADAEPRSAGSLWTELPQMTLWTVSGRSGAPRRTVGDLRYVAPMRPDASVMHLDLDAFYASVEQRDKPSLRGKPVVVGGVGGRGVVATASYEARRYGVRSAMSTREARARCPHAAFLNPRFHAYRDASQAVMAVLRDLSPLVEPLSLDEAFVDLAVSELTAYDEQSVRVFVERVRARVAEVTGGLTASVGVASSKFVAKVASDLDKPDGLVVVAAGTELEPAPPDARDGHPGRRAGDRRAVASGRHLDRRRPRAGQ